MNPNYEVDIFWETIILRCSAFGMTKLARASGVDRVHLYELLRWRRREPTMPTIRKLEKALRELEGDL